MGPIPNSKIIEYGNRKGLEPDMLDVFEIVLDKLDDAWLNKQQRDQDSDRAREEREATRNAGKTKIR